MFKDNGGWNGEGRLRVYFFTPGKEEDEKDVMAGFRTMCKEAPALAGRDVLCFKVKLKHHKKTHSRQLVLFIACPDDARLEEMLQFVVSYLCIHSNLGGVAQMTAVVVDGACRCVSRDLSVHDGG